MKTPRYTDKRTDEYVSAEESRKPGYLAKRLRLYAERQKAEAQAQSQRVTPLRKVAK